VHTRKPTEIQAR